MVNHNKRTHDKLVDRVNRAMKHRWNYDTVRNYYYPLGEIDILRFVDGEPAVAYEIKSNNLNPNKFKAYDQLTRFVNYQWDMYERNIRGVYVSQHSLNGEFVVERMI